MNLSSEYKLVIISVIALIFFGWINWPLNPSTSKESGIMSLVGKPTFEYGSNRSQDTKLIVKGISLICTNPTFFIRSRCEEVKKIVNPNQSVRVTFSKSKGILGIRYFVLQSLEQNGKILLSSSDMRYLQRQAYKKQLEINKLMIIFYIIIFLILLIYRKKVNIK